MAGGGDQKGESLWQKLLLMALDKGLFAAAIALLGIAATTNADHLKTAWSTLWSYQEKIFDKRWEGYSDLLGRADRVLAEAALYYNAPADPADPLAFDPWPAKIDGLRERWRTIGGSLEAAGGSFNDIDDVLSALSDLVRSRAKYALLIPDRLDKSLNNFIRVVQSEAAAEIAGAERRKAAKAEKTTQEPQETPAQTREHWRKILTAYVAFKTELRATLGLDLTPTGG